MSYPSDLCSYMFQILEVASHLGYTRIQSKLIINDKECTVTTTTAPPTENDDSDVQSSTANEQETATVMSLATHSEVQTTVVDANDNANVQDITNTAVESTF